MNSLWALLLWEDDLLDPSAVSSGIYLHISKCGAYMLFLDLSTWGRVYCLPMVGVDWMFYTHRPHPLASGLSLPPMQLHDDILIKSEFSAYMMVIWKDFFCPLPNSGSQFNCTGERPIIPKPHLHPRSRKSSDLPLFLLTLPWMFYFCSHTYLLFFFF